MKKRDAVEPTPQAGMIGGRKNDFPVLKEAAECLSLGVASEMRVISVHQTPDLAFEHPRDSAL